MMDNESVRRLVAKVDSRPLEEWWSVYRPAICFVEPKFDGERVLAHIKNGIVEIVNKRNSKYTDLEEINSTLSNFSKKTVFDCELATPDDDFYNFLRHRANRSGLVLMVFDVLWLNGKDVRSLPLSERKRLLKSSLVETRHVLLVPFKKVRTKEEVLSEFKRQVEEGREGIVVKPYSAPYTAQAIWLKIKKEETEDVVILGFKKTKGYKESGVAWSFLIGKYLGGNRWKIIGTVSSGLTFSQKEALTRIVLKHKIREDREFIYCNPAVVLEISYQEKVKDGSLRHPKVKRIRTDKHPHDCLYI